MRVRVCVCVQRVDQKELPHYIGYLRKALKTVSNLLIGEELHGFSLKVINTVSSSCPYL